MTACVLFAISMLDRASHKKEDMMGMKGALLNYMIIPT